MMTNNNTLLWYWREGLSLHVSLQCSHSLWAIMACKISLHAVCTGFHLVGGMGRGALTPLIYSCPPLSEVVIVSFLRSNPSSPPIKKNNCFTPLGACCIYRPKHLFCSILLQVRQDASATITHCNHPSLKCPCNNTLNTANFAFI